MPRRSAFLTGLAAGAILAVSSGAVCAAEPASLPAPLMNAEDAAAARLLAAGRLDEAKALLLRVREHAPEDNEAAFLLAMIAVQQAEYPRAIHLFREVLARDPKAERVRLELARTFFLAKDYDNAERQFRLARAGKLPPVAMANIDDYLNAIRRVRTHTYSVGLALAPDTNLNAGPQGHTVDIFGLPFELSDQTRRHSGVGVSVDAAGEWSPALNENTRLRLAGQFHRAEYSGGAFDDMTLSAYGGVRLLRGRWEFSPLATVFSRWYGNRPYNHGEGATLQTIWFPTSRTGVSGVIGAQQISYSGAKGQSGPALSGALTVLHTLSPISLVTGGVSVTRQSAELKFYSFTATEVQAAYQRDLPGGFTASIQPSYAQIKYDAAIPAFGRARDDRQLTLEATLLNRRIEFAGFAPRLLYAHIHNTSTISLYAYDRDRLEIGLTRAF